MPEIEIRPAVADDLSYLIKIEHSYQSTFVWQMDRALQDGQITIVFRQTRLPRTVRIEYAGSRPMLGEENWSQYKALLIATVGKIPVGYIGTSEQVPSKVMWITACAVREDYRRQGIGTALILAAQEWGAEKGFRKAILELQSKNHPGVQLARKLGYEFCGYNDHYFPNQDIALFFSRSLR
jgi:ribosomal protein S18 acetylase RimI-like enzyme